jgi:hypothetical protein
VEAAERWGPATKKGRLMTAFFIKYQ